MMYFLLSCLLYVSRAVNGDDCAYFNGMGVDQCVVLGDLSFLDGSVAMMVECSDDGWEVSFYTDNKCKDDFEIPDSLVDEGFTQAAINAAITLECEAAGDQVCYCGEDTKAADCYFVLNAYEDCDEDSDYDSDDLILSLPMVVNVCIMVGEDDDGYNAAVPKWSTITCDDSSGSFNQYSPMIETFYIDEDCTTEYMDPDWQCPDLTSESLTCDVTVSVAGDQYCGTFEGHPLGVCSKMGTFWETGSSESYSQSVMYWCNEYGEYFENTYESNDCSGDMLGESESVECAYDHNCECGVEAGTGATCGYNAFSYVASGTCNEASYGDTATVEYEVILEENTCFRTEDEQNGVQYACTADGTGVDNLEFTIYLEDPTCAGDVACTYEKTVDCDYQTGDGDCNYFQNYPVNECAVMVEQDIDGELSEASYSVYCDSGTLMTQMWNNYNCSGTPASDEVCYDCSTNDAGEEQCTICKGSCDDTSGLVCDLVEVTESVTCTLISSGASYASVSTTQLMIENRCQDIGQVYRQDTCSAGIITQTVYTDETCATASSECSESQYSGEYGLSTDDQELEVAECSMSDDDDNCAYVEVFPVDTCVIGYTDGDMEHWSAEYSCRDDVDAIKVSLYQSFDCSGDPAIEYNTTCTEEDIECNCDGSGEDCSSATLTLADPCLMTDTYVTVRIPGQCIQISDEDTNDWDLYIGFQCYENEGIAYELYEDDECEDVANALRWSDGDCWYFAEYEGVCGDWPDNGNSSSANNVYYFVAVIYIAIIALFV